VRNFKNAFLVMLAAQLSVLKHGYTYTSLYYRSKSKIVWNNVMGLQVM